MKEKEGIVLGGHMILNSLVYYIHYCNSRMLQDHWKKPPKVHRTLQHHEFILFIGGKGIVTIQKRKYSVKSGMLFYFYPGLFHSITSDLNEPLCFLSVHFSYGTVSYINGNWDIKKETRLLPFNRVQIFEETYQIKKLFHQLIDTWNGKLPGYEFVCKVTLQQIIITINQNIKVQSQNYSATLKVEKIIKFMQDNLNRKITLCELSAFSDISPYYLSRLFKETTGYSVIEFFNKMKIDKAKELLEENDIKIKEVARVLGFSDEFYFSRLFKKTEGISPSEYHSNIIHEL